MRNKPPMTMPEDGGSIPHIMGTDQLGRDELSRLSSWAVSHWQSVW